MNNNNLYYKDEKSLKLFLNENNISDSEYLLIQVFTSQSTPTFIKEIINNLNFYLPRASIIGATTDGEIMDGKVSENKTVISFTNFSSTALKVIDLEHTDRGFKTGQNVATTLISKDTKAIISFATCYNTSGEDYLNGISSVNDDIIVAGGIASHNKTTTDTYVFTKNGIISKGVVAVSFESEHLIVQNNFSYNWSTIGLEFIIDKVTDNRVYKIDGKTAYDLYVHYLGEDIAHNLPASGTEFPLIIKRDDFLISRAVIEVHGDGSLSFAGDFKVGDKVQFGYGDIKSIHKKSSDISKSVSQNPAEVIFIYSCMARRHYLNEDIENETLPLEQIAPTSGFFTHGEFYTNKRKEFLNQTMTLLVLSEEQTNPEVKKITKKSKTFSNQAISINALANLINVVSDEVNIQRKELLKQKNLFELFFEKSSDGILIMKDSHIVQCNERAYKILGYSSKEELLKKHPSEISPQYQFDGQMSLDKANKMIGIASLNGIHQFEWLHLKMDKTPIWIDIRLSSLIIENEQYIYVTWRDIQSKKEMESELKEQKNILEHQAHHDALTELPNRILFNDRLIQAIEKGKRSNSKFALLFIDLDHFKEINDSLGHAVGDEILKTVTLRLEETIREEDTVARLGGDEFTVILEDLKEPQDASFIANKILQSLSKSMSVNDNVLYVSSSIGISIYPDDGDSPQNLLKFADSAMYKAKDEGRNNYQYYNSTMTELAFERVVMEASLRAALKEQQFVVYYQPQVNGNTNKLIGMEALVRWQHPTMGLVSPAKFIPLAESTGLIVELDRFVMKTAMNQIAQWYKEGLNPGRLAMNLAMKQLKQKDFIEMFQSLIKETGCKSEWIELEVTEGQIMTNPEKAILVLKQISNLGIELAVDDFGTGYSSLAYLKRLPIDKLKIDQAFVRDLPDDEEDAGITKAVIALAKSLNLRIIAEGVETKEQKDFIVENGCDNIQGYYYSKPVPFNELEVILRDGFKGYV